MVNHNYIASFKTAPKSRSHQHSYCDIDCYNYPIEAPKYPCGGGVEVGGTNQIRKTTKAIFFFLVWGISASVTLSFETIHLYFFTLLG